jgi:hypothetical protein
LCSDGGSGYAQAPAGVGSGDKAVALERGEGISKLEVVEAELVAKGDAGERRLGLL